MSAGVIYLAAGGTGGHIFPAIAVATELLKRGKQAALMTDFRGARFVSEGLPFPVHVLPGDGNGNVIRRGLSVLRGVLAARRLLKQDAQAVMGFGGYASAAALLAAQLRKLPIFLHEQNAVLGRVNRFFARGAQAIALSFPETRLIPSRVTGRTVNTGNPVRQDITDLAGADYQAPRSEGLFRILVIGGSQGASVLSKVVPAALVRLDAAQKQRLQISHQARPEDMEQVTAEYKDAGVAADVRSFFDDVAERLRWSHLVIARAGASTISELAVLGRPAILVPLPSATDNHQYWNAYGLVQVGAAWLHPQDEFTAESLAKDIKLMLSGLRDLKTAAQNMASFGKPDAAAAVADILSHRLDPAMRAAARARRGAVAKPDDDASLREALAW